MHWYSRIRSTENPNSSLARTEFENGIVIDVPVSICKMDSQQEYKIERVKHESECAKSALIVLQGVHYNRMDGFDFLSCGGLLARFPVSEGNILAISSSRRRQRE